MSKVMVVAAVLAAAAVLLALLWPALRHRAIYPGGRLPEAMADPALHGLRDAEQVWLEAEDGVRVHAWWTPARSGDGGEGPGPGADDDPGGSRDPGEPGPAARGAVIYCHGNAESMASRAWIADRLARRGFDVLLFDYRGYGRSEGRASEEGLAADARAAWRHVVITRGHSPDRVVLVGHSLGSAVATRLALEVEAGEVEAAGGGGAEAETESRAGGGDGGPAGLVVGSPFPDMPTLFRHHAPWLPGFMLRWRTDRLDAGSRLADVDAPVLVVVGTEDATIPPGISRAVYEATGAPGARLVEVPAEHGTLMGHPETWRALEALLERVAPRP